MKLFKIKNLFLISAATAYGVTALAGGGDHGAGNIIQVPPQQHQQQQQQQQAQEVSCDTANAIQVDVEEAIFSTGGSDLRYSEAKACVSSVSIACDASNHIGALKWTSTDPTELYRNSFSLVCQPNLGEKIKPQVQHQQQTHPANQFYYGSRMAHSKEILPVMGFTAEDLGKFPTVIRIENGTRLDTGLHSDGTRYNEENVGCGNYNHQMQFGSTALLPGEMIIYNKGQLIVICE